MRTRRFPALLAGLLLLVLSAAPVSAGRLTVTKYTANYNPLPGMTARCAGLHTVTSNRITDNEICLVTDSTHTLVAGTFSATDYFGSWPAFDDPKDHTTVWISDFYVESVLASSWKVVVVPLGHGKFIWLIKAHYPLDTLA